VQVLEVPQSTCVIESKASLIFVGDIARQKTYGGSLPGHVGRLEAWCGGGIQYAGNLDGHSAHNGTSGESSVHNE
jgi:hypothetical protein